MATILVVDDDPIAVEELEYILRDHLVLPYESTFKGIEAIKEGLQYDLLITDYAFKESHVRDGKYEHTGAGVVRESKKAHPETPRAYFSNGRPEILDRNTHFINKTWDEERIRARVEEMLR